MGSIVALKRLIFMPLWRLERQILSNLLQATHAMALRVLKSLLESIMKEPRYLKSSTRLRSRPELALRESWLDEVEINYVFDSLQMSPTAEQASSRECSSNSALEIDSAIRARSSAKYKSVKYWAGLRDPLRFLSKRPKVLFWSREVLRA